jgi:hypothetical protein
MFDSAYSLYKGQSPKTTKRNVNFKLYYLLKDYKNLILKQKKRLLYVELKTNVPHS